MVDVTIWKKHELDDLLDRSIDWSLYGEDSPVLFHAAQPALIASYAVLWIVGALANVWVAVVVGYLLVRIRSHRSRDAPLTVQIYVFSLCLFDLLVLMFLPLLLVDLIYGSWTIPSSSLCKMYLLSEGFNKFGVPWLLTALSGFCCSNIRRVTKFTITNNNESSCDEGKNSVISLSSHHRRRRKLSRASKRESDSSVERCPIRKDNGRRSVATVFLFTVAVLLAMSPVLLYSDIYFIAAQNGTQIQILASKCAFQPPDNILTMFTVYSFLFGYLCPTFLFTYYYVTILTCMKRQKRRLSLSSPFGRQSQQRYCRVAKTAVGLVSWTLAGWTPYWTIFLYFYFNPQTDTEDMADSSTTVLLSYCVHMLPYITCTGYPILYTLLNKNIRTAYAKAKLASANRRQRRRLVSMGTKITLIVGTNSSDASTKAALRSSLTLDDSSCDTGMHSIEETSSLPLNAI